MKPSVSLVVLVVLGFPLGILGQGPGVDLPATFSVQLIRGTDQEKPQEPGWKPVEAKLRGQFDPVFRWKRYWEVNRVTASVPAGKPARVRLSGQREVEIVLLNPKEAEVRLFVDGHLTRKTRECVQQGNWIMGGSRDRRESWFIVVAPAKRAEVREALRK